MAEMKTKLTDLSVGAFLNKIVDEQKRMDAFAISESMKKITKSEARMWGPSIVGFGDSLYKLATGKEIQWFKVGFSPRKSNFSLYISSGFSKYAELLGKLGKHKTSKACLYINKLEDVDFSVLKEMIKHSLTCFAK